MAFLTGKISLVVYTDAAQTNFPQQLILNEAPEWSSSAITQVQTTTFTLAALGTQTISLNGLSSVTGFYVYSNTTTISVNINGLGNVTYQAGVPGFVPATVTSLVVTNASASAATTVTVSLIAG